VSDFVLPYGAMKELFAIIPVPKIGMGGYMGAQWPMTQSGSFKLIIERI
jgi:hypothetical protein